VTHNGPRIPPMNSLSAPVLHSDALLASRIREGEMQALDLVFERYATQLLRLATRLTGSEADGEDVVQDVFVGLPLALRRYEERGQFGPWIRRVTTRTALMRLRRVGTRGEVSLDGVGEPEQPQRMEIERIGLERAIAALPESLRVVFVLREVEGHSHAEIAALLGISRSASEVRLHRAVQRLRLLLRGEAW
jgi:RNA polymerase sigma-70 factor, ECF subfamily